MKTTIIIILCCLLSTGCTSTGKAGSKREAALYNAKLGAGYLQRNRLELAKEHLEKALQRDPRSPQAQHYYALLQKRLGNNASAAAYFQKALRSDPQNPELLNNYGSFLCQQGNIQQAEAIFLRVSRNPLYKTPEFALANAGICLKKTGNIRKAEAYFRQALQVRRDFPSALFHMADLSHQQNQNAKAQAFLYRYNERMPQTAETLLLCYKIHTALYENQAAEQCASQLLAKFPRSEEAQTLD